MKTNHSTLIIIFSLAVCSLLTGCFSDSIYIVHHTDTAPRSPYKFKFYVEDIQVVLIGGMKTSNPGRDKCAYANITLYCYDKSKDEAEEKGLDIHAEIRYREELIRRHKYDKEIVNTTRNARRFVADLKRELVARYPEFFTDDRANALPISFQYRGAYLIHQEAHVDTLISTLTMGLTPALMKRDYLYFIHPQIDKIKEEYNFSVKSYQRSNYGLLGIFLPTSYLIPIPPDADDQYTGLKVHYMLMRVSDKMLRAFCYALMELDHNTIHRLYNEKYTSEVKF